MLTHILTLYAALRRHLNYLRTLDADYIPGNDVEPIRYPPLTATTRVPSFEDDRAPSFPLEPTFDYTHHISLNLRQVEIARLMGWDRN